MKYVALLRGINLGKRQMKMAEVRQLFEDLGFEAVSTLLASGNVVFTSNESDPGKLRAIVESGISEKYGFEVRVLLRTAAQIENLVKRDLFKKVAVTKETRLYITFLDGPAKGGLTLPYKSEDGFLQILEANQSEVVSVVVISPQGGTLKLMDLVGKEYGDDGTTRNWNTVLKIHARLQAG